MPKIRMTIGKIALDAELFDTPTAQAILAACPIESRAATWGLEVYFTVPVKAEREEQAREVIEAGELAYRAEGEAIVIGYGPTPHSQADEIRLALPANVWGRALGDVTQLAQVEPGELVLVDVIDDNA